MKIIDNRTDSARYFEALEAGDVFYSDTDPNNFFLRTDEDDWVAVDLQTGGLYHVEDFNMDNAQYHCVNAELTVESWKTPN